MGGRHQQLTRKYPFYVWHLTKRFKSLSQMDAELEDQESQYISLYSSDYMREAIEATAAQREAQKKLLKGHDSRVLPG